MQKTHLINTRDTIIFDIVNNDLIFDELYYHLNNLKKELNQLNINYDKLKRCLIPANNGDIAFVFNLQNIDNPIYGEYILNLLMPFLINNNFCYLHGDYGLISEEHNVKLNKFNAMNDALYNKINYFIDPSSCYIIYITNIGIKNALKIDAFLKANEVSYLGFADLKNNNLFKTFLSIIIGQTFIKLNQNIIECNASISNCEITNIPHLITLKKYINRIIDVPAHMHDIFLLYKIPSILEPQYRDRDLYYSFKYLDKNIDNNFIKDFKIIINDNKINYLFNKKSYITDKWNIQNHNKLKEFLIFKIKQSILLCEIFNLEIKKEYNTYQFDICIEHMNIKYIVGLKLLYKQKEIHFITLSSNKIKH